LHELYEWEQVIVGVVGVCFTLTWLEAVLGFCVGCWLHARLFGCEVCEVAYRNI